VKSVNKSTLFNEILKKSLDKNSNSSKSKENKSPVKENLVENCENKNDTFNYSDHKEKLDFLINLLILCPDRKLSDIVTSIEFYIQKFGNAKSTALVKFI
jgi:hypothetical protein